LPIDNRLSMYAQDTVHWFLDAPTRTAARYTRWKSILTICCVRSFYLFQ